MIQVNYNDGRIMVAGLSEYNPQDGRFRMVKDWGKRRKGDLVGKHDKDGYWMISVGGSWKRAHRIAWEVFYGAKPQGEIDHINGIRDDNRIENLRLATHPENHQNKRAHSGNPSGEVGVSKCSHTGRWRARIKVDGVEKHIGQFKTVEGAKQAYAASKKDAHSFNPSVREVLE